MSRDGESLWSYELVRTRDGLRQGRVFPVGFGSWARRLDEKSPGQHVFHLGSNPEVWARMRPARRTLVVCYDGEPVYAGVIWAAAYNRSAGTVTLNHEDIWSIWDRRFATPRAEMDADEGSYMAARYVRYSGISRRTHAKRIVQLGMSAPEPRDGTTKIESYQLPVILPSDETGGWAFTHRVYNFPTVSAALARITRPGDPMQVDFPVEWTSQGNLAWRLQVSHSSPTRTFLTVNADQSPVSDLTLSHDMTDYSSEIHATGDGQAEDTTHRLRWLGDIQSDIIALARESGFNGVDVSDELVEVLDGLAQQYRIATVQVDATVTVGGDHGVSPHDFSLGQQVVLRINDDLVFPDGDHSFMLIGYAPVGPHELRLELSPVDGFTGYSTEEETFNYRNLNASQVGRLSSRVHRAEKRLIYPHGGATVAALTSTKEGS